MPVLLSTYFLKNISTIKYMVWNLFSFFKADKLISKSTFPESASNNDWARYLYYIGKVLYKDINLLGWGDDLND